MPRRTHPRPVHPAAAAPSRGVLANRRFLTCSTAIAVSSIHSITCVQCRPLWPSSAVNGGTTNRDEGGILCAHGYSALNLRLRSNSGIWRYFVPGAASWNGYVWTRKETPFPATASFSLRSISACTRSTRFHASLPAV